MTAKAMGWAVWLFGIAAVGGVLTWVAFAPGPIAPGDLVRVMHDDRVYRVQFWDERGMWLLRAADGSDRTPVLADGDELRRVVLP